MNNPQSSDELAEQKKVEALEEAEHDKYECEECQQVMQD